MRKIATYTLLLFAAAVSGCIKNDIPYPVVECRIESITAEGLAGEPLVDYATRTVTLPLLETTDIQNVEITEAVITDLAKPSQPIVGRHDLREPLHVVLSLYSDYAWTIEAQQTIARHFTIEGQVGAAEWDYFNRTVKAYLAYRGDDITTAGKPTGVKITSLKLGPEGITTMRGTDDVLFDTFPMTYDFESERRVDVECHGRTETWYINVEYTDMKVDLKRVDAWVRTAWLYGEGLSDTDLGFRYRRKGAEEWITADAPDDSGEFSVQIRGLEPETEYEVVAYSDDNESFPLTFTTQPELPLPNADFEIWSTIGGLVCPYLSTDEMFWDTGNKGAATVGAVLTEGTSDIRPGSTGRTAASLTSKFAGYGSLGKFAAGNIFLGKYAETVGTNGKVNFGRPFTSRPTALHGWLKFTNGEIDNTGSNFPAEMMPADRKDQGQIYIALGTWTAAEYGGTAESPVQVYSRETSTFFNKNSKDVIGYGELTLTEPVDGWTEFTINIDYKATDIIPTHLIIVCSASRWGDYFTGSTQNRLWLDDFELLWE